MSHIRLINFIIQLAASTLTAIIFLNYRVPVKMALEFWGTPCAGFDYDGW